jgi:penicillin-binding protein 1C
MAPQLLQSLLQEHPGIARFESNLDQTLQRRCQEVLDRHIGKHIGNQIGSGAIVVARAATGEVLAYIGNTQLVDAKEFGSWNNMAATPRSTGSVLKPFLYASMLSEGHILPHSLVEDLPYYLGGYAPKNYSHTYDGLVPASLALSRSLNVPAVLMLHKFGVNKFIDRLQTLGMSTLDKPASHYGLSLILGGAECTLYELTGMYASMARLLLRPFQPVETGLHIAANTNETRSLLPSSFLNLGAVYHTFNSMEEVARPDNQTGWQSFSSSRKVAWKTGTSFGYRDAWAVGFDGGFVVGVWMGNADGTGREGLVGVEVAAPVMFDIFNLLPQSQWFEPPQWAMKTVVTCVKSGYPAFDFCPETDSILVPNVDWQLGPCPYHKLLTLTPSREYQVNDACTAPHERITVPWFLLPPVHAHYFAKTHAWFATPPPFRADCTGSIETKQLMSLIYPPAGSGIKIPVELDGQKGKAILQLAHSEPDTRVFWYWDDQFLGFTDTYHEMAISPLPGNHNLLVTDEDGNQLKATIRVLK